MIILFSLHILQITFYLQFIQFRIHVPNENDCNNENLALIQLTHNIILYKIIINLLLKYSNKF